MMHAGFLVSLGLQKNLKVVGVTKWFALSMLPPNRAPSFSIFLLAVQCSLGHYLNSAFACQTIQASIYDISLHTR